MIKTENVKRFCRLMFCVSLYMICSGMVFAQSMGDVNNSGTVDIVDALLIAQYAVGLNPVNFNTAKADVNCLNGIDIIDALLIAQYSVGIITGFPCEGPTPTPTQLPSSSVLLIGRFDTSDAAGPKAAWSASTIKARFQGTSVQANIKSSGDNWFNVVIDGTAKASVNIPSGASMPETLISGLSSGTHTIELVKRTEANQGDFQFLGFIFPNGTQLTPPAASARRIEFIGDSITCGYGNEGTSQYQSFTTKNENAYLAYGSVTARLLNADQITVAWSGKGVIRNYGGDTNQPMPAVYPQILPWSATPVWDYTKWIPQVVVINLCTNDYSVGIPDRTQFTTAYSNLVKKVRSQYAGAMIYCALGPMLNDNNLASARDYITSVVNQLKSAGDAKIKFIEFPVQEAANGYGEDWHPSVKTHALMADQLSKQIKTDLGW